MQDDLLRASLTDAQEISQARVRKEARGSDCRDPPEDFSGTRRVELRSLMSLPGTNATMKEGQSQSSLPR